MAVSLRFLTRTCNTVVAVRADEVNTLPDSGPTKASILRSLLEMSPMQDPLLGCLDTVLDRRPGLPFNLALTPSQYSVSFDRPPMVNVVNVVVPIEIISSPRNIITS